MNGGWGISYEIALRWKPLDLTDDKSTLVQVMAGCRQATSHYLSQCWPGSMSPNGVTRPQWVKHQWNRQNHSPSNRPIMNVFMGTGSYIQTYTWKNGKEIRAWKGCEIMCRQNMILITQAKALFPYQDHLSRYGIMIKIQWSWDHLIFYHGDSFTGNMAFYIETALGSFLHCQF